MTRTIRRKLIAAGLLIPIRGFPPLPETWRDPSKGGRPRAPFVSDKVERRRKRQRDYWTRKRMRA